MKYPYFEGTCDNILMNWDYRTFLVNKHSEKQRYYHNMDHIERLCELLLDMEGSLDTWQSKILSAVIVFHDSVYDPLSLTNEEDSAELFNSWILSEDPDHQRFELSEIAIVAGVINSTNLKSNIEKKDSLEYIFRQLDTYDLCHFDVERLIRGEMLIQKEFQVHPWEKYVEGKMKFLDSIENMQDGMYKQACDISRGFVNGRTPNIGVYAGTFSIFHKGHLSILRQSEKMFDKVILVAAINPGKEGAARSLETRHHTLNNLMRFHQVDKTEDLLTDYLKSFNYPVTLIRGLRTDVDFKEEEKKLRLMQDLYPEIKVAFIPCEKKYEHISSSTIVTFRHFGNAGEMYEVKDPYGLDVE